MLEDAVQQDEELVDRAVRESALVDERAAPVIDLAGRDLLQLEVPERRVEMHADGGAVVVERGALALAIELLPAKPLARGLRERRARADHARQGACPRLGEQLVEDRLG